MKREIKFNSLYSSNNYTKNLEKLLADYELFRQKHFSNACLDILNDTYSKSELLLTHSATGALEMIALCMDIQEGDEIILPSFTFVSTANAFALRGAKLVFVDIELDTLGIDPILVEKAITNKTKAIIGVHYAGNSCKIKQLKKLAEHYDVALIEDAAMAFGASLEGEPLGVFGDFAVLSFDVTKHISGTQGGCLIINNKAFISKAHEIYHIGTNRTAFEDKKVPYYEWVSLGSKFQMPETNAAILYSQLLEKEAILNKLNTLSNLYFQNLEDLEFENKISLMPLEHVQDNFHEFYLLLISESERNRLSKYLAEKNIEALFHYVPLHSSIFGKMLSDNNNLTNTSLVSENLLRLPLHTGLEADDVIYVCEKIKAFFQT